MQALNRQCLLIKPQQPFLDWLHALPDAEAPHPTLEDIRKLGSAYLIPDVEDEDAQQFLQNNWEFFFEEMLEGWYMGPDDWPQARTFAMFQQWFTVESYQIVVDVVGTPIELEEW